MSKTISLRNSTLAIFTLAILSSSASAQTVAATPATAPATPGVITPAESQSPRRATTRRPAARVTVIANQSDTAPQVVTIVHRLSGVKLLRMLQRQAGETGVIETIDPSVLTGAAHATIIAGWAMDDGKTITARLPQAAAEIEVTEFERPTSNQPEKLSQSNFVFARPAVEPDLTVITNDGRKLRAQLIGLDAETGLSVLQVAGILPPPPKQIFQKLVAGETIRIFAPEPTTPGREPLARATYVKLGKIDATVSTLVKTNSGKLEKLIVRGDRLSPNVIGGIACDQSGATIGIIESIEGGDGNVISAETVRAATRRVLDRQASVPRPLLGVRGEPVESAGRAALLAHGWRDDQVKALIDQQVGILLTLVVPRTPAALANLRPGDVIVRVNQHDVKSAEDFSQLLGEVGSGERVEFTVKRPDAGAPMRVPVTLGQSFAPFFERFEVPRVATSLFGLQQLGIQTMPLTPKVAAEMGAEHGFIVIAVQSQSAATRAGIREGDVIESLDGRILGPSLWTLSPEFGREKKHTLTIVRNREKKQVVVETLE